MEGYLLGGEGAKREKEGEEVITKRFFNFNVPYTLQDLYNDLLKEEDKENATFKNYTDTRITLIPSGRERK